MRMARALSNASIFSLTIRYISSGVPFPRAIKRRRISMTCMASAMSVRNGYQIIIELVCTGEVKGGKAKLNLGAIPLFLTGRSSDTAIAIHCARLSLGTSRPVSQLGMELKLGSRDMKQASKRGL